MQQINFEKINYKKIINFNNERFVVQKNNELFYFKLHLKEYSRKIVIFLNGALDIAKKQPPVFMRESWQSEFDFNAIFIDDKTIHNNELSIGWGIGSLDRHFLVDYSEIIKKITNELGIKNEDVYYYGSSAGGFMSMGLSSMHDKTTAIVNNPQAFVYNYFESHVNKILDTIFTGKDRTEVFKEYAERFSITALFKKHERVPNIYYIQNRLCKTDMRNQYSPFIQAMDKYKIDTSSINFILYNNYESKHTPLGKEKTLKIIKSIINKDMFILN